jgi:hypothetical protein
MIKYFEKSSLLNLPYSPSLIFTDATLHIAGLLNFYVARETSIKFGLRAGNKKHTAQK